MPRKTPNKPSKSKAKTKIKLLPAPTQAESAARILQYLNEYTEAPETNPIKDSWEHATKSRGWK